MLAQNFKTAADLGIKDAELDALIKVLGMLERGEIEYREAIDWFEPRKKVKAAVGFNMYDFYARADCGTVCCLCGWAEIVGNLPLFSLVQRRNGNQKLYDLFEPDRTLMKYSEITPAQAAIALRSYLTTGEANWAEALSV